MKKLIKKSIQIFILLIAALVSGCTGEKKKDNESGDAAVLDQVTLTEAQYKNAGIVLGSLAHSPLRSVLKVSGHIDVPPQNMVSISVPLGGYLQSIKLLPGMHLNKGEVIAIMEDQQYIQLQQDYLMAKANFGYIESEYLRQKELNLSKASSDKEFEQARATYLSQKISINALAEKLKLIGINPGSLDENNISKSIRILSPINGFVSKVNINIGKYVAPSDILFELVNPTDIHLNMMVFEKDIDKLYIGQKVMAYTNADPGKKYECDVILVGKDVSGQRYVEVHCHFKEYDKNLIPGMYMNAEIEVQSKDAAVVPEEAVVHFDGKDYVFLETTARTYHMQQVELALTGNGVVEIRDAAVLESGRLVVKGAYALLMMAKNNEEEE